jgi:ribose 5-phosphate isomerase A
MSSKDGQQSPVEMAKRKAAYQAVDDFVKDKQMIGIGSGSTVVYAVERLAQRVKDEKLSIVCVPTSFQATNLIIQNGLQLGDLNRFPELDLTIDGADEVDENLNLIKGGGACQTQEKLVAANSKQLVIIADYRKDSKSLGEKWRAGVPIEVLQLGYVSIMKKLAKLGGKPVLRMGMNKAGPVVTDNGHLVIDADFGEIKDPGWLNQQLKMIAGVVETGLFVNMACKAYFGQADGAVSHRESKIKASPLTSNAALPMSAVGSNSGSSLQNVVASPLSNS